jgi:hypothetical protein
VADTEFGVTQIISSISGYFSKSLILGTFLPVVIFIVLTAIFVVPFLPLDFPALVRFQNLDKEWKTVATSFVTIVLTGLIYNLNIPILRLFEGYPWRNSWLGTFLTRRHQARFDDAQNRIAAMRACRRLMQDADKDFTAHKSWVEEFFGYWKALGSPLQGAGRSDYEWLKKIWTTQPASENQPDTQAPADKEIEAQPTSSDATKQKPKSDLQVQWETITANFNSEYGVRLRYIQSNYPDRRNLILPTRLGNVIRSFEYYPGREYRIDSIALWPRLVAIIPKDYAVAVDDAKTTFDFMLNCSLLSVILTVSILLAGLIYAMPLNSWSLGLYWFGNVAFFASLSYFFYRLSIDRVSAWGAMVKGAFDLYRSELLKKLGYKHEPASRQKERDLWEKISRQIIYGDLDRVPLDYVEESGPSYPSLSSTPAKAKLEITKGVKASAEDFLIFCLQIKNTDPQIEETDVTVTDKLSEDLYYQWQSARVDSVPAAVSGANPYKFVIGSIPSNQEVVLTYKVIRRKGMN